MTTTSHREWALAYAIIGWPVFPLRAASKHPLLQGGFLRATTDTETINRWWNIWPNASIGIATGRAFDAIDLDNEAARQTYEERSAILGPVSKTPKGWHILVKPTHLRNLRAVLPGIDFRGEGGLIIVPPSIHESGERYRWITDPATPLPEMPDWFKTELTAKATTRILDHLSKADQLDNAIGLGHVMASEGHPLTEASTYRWGRCQLHDSTRNSLLVFPTEDIYRCTTCGQYGPAQPIYDRYHADKSPYWTD